MKVLAINASPRKKWNTAMMVDSALEGAICAGAEGRRVDLYDYDFKGCYSCFECKRTEGPNFGRCAAKDGLTALLDEAVDADILLIGTPIYFNDVTGMLRSFLERLYFPTLTYTKAHTLLYKKRKQVGWLFTTNAPGSFYPDYYKSVIAQSERLLGHSEYVDASETLQFTDYSIYAADMFDVPARQDRREKIFPEDLKNAFRMGANLVENWNKENGVK